MQGPNKFKRFIITFFKYFRTLVPKYETVDFDYCKAFFNDEYNFLIPSWLYNTITGFYIYFIYKHFKGKMPSYNLFPQQQSILIEEDKSIFMYDNFKSIYNNSPLFDYIIISSYADKTQTIESDIDDVIIIDERVFDSFRNFRKAKDILQKLNLLYQQIDPLQHHGHWIFFKHEFNYFNQSIIPVCVLENGVSIGRDVEIYYYVDEEISSKGYFDIIHLQLDNIKKKTAKLFSEGINLFELKNFISSITLVLPLLFQIKGEFVRKDVAIKKANQILDENALKVLIFTSELRERWSELPVSSLYEKVRFKSKRIKNRKQLEAISKSDKNMLKMENLPIGIKLQMADFEHYVQILENHLD